MTKKAAPARSQTTTATSSSAGIVQDVLSRVKTTKSGYKSWHEKLPAEMQEEFAEARRQYRAGDYTQAAFARAIIEVAADRGVAPPTLDQVCRWLRQNPS
jgi:hypothetical protein